MNGRTKVPFMLQDEDYILLYAHRARRKRLDDKRLCKWYQRMLEQARGQ